MEESYQSLRQKKKQYLLHSLHVNKGKSTGEKSLPSPLAHIHTLPAGMVVN